MKLTSIQVSASIDDIFTDLGKALSAFERIQNLSDKDYNGNLEEWLESDIKWCLTLAFTKLLTLTEACELPLLRISIAEDFQSARGVLLERDLDPDGEPHLKWGNSIRTYLFSLQTLVADGGENTITRNLESILRATVYSICDRKAFGSPPKNEDEVHDRIEAILKCVFPDLIHKPRLSKLIKGFEPDTGIPSLRTLIEYKYISDRKKGKRVADELLADTKGYYSAEWSNCIFVIYETIRFKPESDWRAFLFANGVDSSSTVIVIQGENRSSLGKRQNRQKSIKHGSS